MSRALCKELRLCRGKLLAQWCECLAVLYTKVRAHAGILACASRIHPSGISWKRSRSRGVPDRLEKPHQIYACNLCPPRGGGIPRETCRLFWLRLFDSVPASHASIGRSVLVADYSSITVSRSLYRGISLPSPAFTYIAASRPTGGHSATPNYVKKV